MPLYNRGYYGDPEAMSDAELFKLLRKATRPKPRLLLTKSLAAPRRKPLAKKPVLVRVKQPTDRELAIHLGDACARGWLSGTDALAAQQAVDAGRKMPAEVRVILLDRYAGGR